MAAKVNEFFQKPQPQNNKTIMTTDKEPKLSVSNETVFHVSILKRLRSIESELCKCMSKAEQGDKWVDDIVDGFASAIAVTERLVFNSVGEHMIDSECNEL